jgi:Arc/MetJ family transcription regulator
MGREQLRSWPALDETDTINGKQLTIRSDLVAAELRRLVRRERDRSAAARMQANAGVLEGMTCTKAARLAGMERQALRDAVRRYNAEGLTGLHDRPWPGAKPQRTRPAVQHCVN